VSSGDGAGARMRRVFVICGAVCSGRSAGLCVAEDRCGCSAVNAALERAEPWVAEERADGRTAFWGGSLEVVMRCRC
jgi:hypothetical protein